MNFIYNSFILFLISVLLGCGSDPILDRAEELKEDKKPPKTSTAEKASSPPKTSPPVVAPPTVQPPKVEPPKALAEGRVDPPPKNPKDGPFITIKGKIEVGNWSGKEIKIDIFDGDQRKIDGDRPSVIVSEILKKQGSFEIHLPQSDKQLWIGASIDEDGDGRPGPQDPSGWYPSNPLSAKKDHTGVNFSLDVPDDPNPR